MVPDRDLALARLRGSYVADELDLDEFASRVDRIFSAQTQSDIDAALTGLAPAAPPALSAEDQQLAYETVRPHLISGEEVLWLGKPDPGHRFSPADKFLVPFSLVWGGFAIFWEIAAITAVATQGGGSILFPLFGLPFVGIGLYMIFGRFIYKRRRKERLTYVVTNRRVITLEGGSRGGEVAAAFVSSIPSINSNASTDGVGTVTFGNSTYQQALYANSGMESFGWAGASGAICFFDIPGAAKVADLVSRLRDEQWRPGLQNGSSLSELGA